MSTVDVNKIQNTFRKTFTKFYNHYSTGSNAKMAKRRSSNLDHQLCVAYGIKKSDKNKLHYCYDTAIPKGRECPYP